MNCDILASSEALCRYVTSLPAGRYFVQIGSTNDEARRLGEMGEPEGAVLVAEMQTHGRGRLTRRWLAPPGSSLLMSLLFRPPQPFEVLAPRVTMVCGIALTDAVRHMTGVPVQLKWPNDLIVAEAQEWRKLAGMLSEVGSAQGPPEFLVVGIGMNVNIAVEQLPQLAANATSLWAETGHLVARVPLLAAFLDRVRPLIAQVYTGWDPLALWQARLAWLGQWVHMRTPKRSFRGIAERVAPDGALLLRSADGALRRFPVGDVSLRP